MNLDRPAQTLDRDGPWSMAPRSPHRLDSMKNACEPRLISMIRPGSFIAATRDAIALVRIGEIISDFFDQLSRRSERGDFPAQSKISIEPGDRLGQQKAACPWHLKSTRFDLPIASAFSRSLPGAREVQRNSRVSIYPRNICGVDDAMLGAMTKARNSNPTLTKR